MNRKEMIKYAVVGVFSAISTALIIGGVLLMLLRYAPHALAPVISSIEEFSLNERSVNSGVTSAELGVIDVVKMADPAVVAITVSKNVPVYEQYYGSISPFDDFFGGFFRVPQIRQNGTELQEVGGGSGFIVSPDGYIVTNRHVVFDESAQYTVFTNDGEKHDATVIARDAMLDIAVIKIEGENFSYLSFGDSSSLQVGQSVIAIGNALAEFRNTVSVGVVSGLSRSIVASDRQGGVESLEELIQTDAAINGGNSGGPLLDLNGNVIGVNVAIVSGAQNVGFALSSNSVKNVVESVRETGKISRPYLGVRYIPITEELSESNNLKFDYGVLVQRGETPEDLAIIPGSPADKSGILENDIILEIDGKKLDAGNSLSTVIAGKKAGDEISLKIYSKGKEKIVTVRLEEFDI
jgi:serine protease Do